ncbi:kinase-like domain-containing protein [Parasitella parasitica]|nr:kinase-like domain-containing protein [Parasitella parasitica]
MTQINYVTVPISKENKAETFTVNAKYRIIRKVGSGAYGTVCSAFDLQHQQYCAIKKVYRVFDKKLLTRRCLREMKLLRLFNNHPRIIELFDMDMLEESEEIYLIFGCMDASLHDVIHSKQPLDIVHSQWFLFQILSGLKYIHTANVIHRDLKPANILVNRDCDIRICDFGMARSFNQTDSSLYLTEYVTTRWYRSPEIMVSGQNYSKAIDIWSVGCIFGEILGRKVLFKGRDHIDQLHKILGIMGLPKDVSFWDLSRNVSSHLHSICTTNGQPFPTESVDFTALFPSAPPEAIEVLKSLLDLNPIRRINVEEALKCLFIRPFSDPIEESLVPPATMPNQYSFENCSDENELKQMVIHEVASFKHQQEERVLDKGNGQHPSLGNHSMLRRYHTMAGDNESFCTTPTQKLDHLPSASMSLFEQYIPTTTSIDDVVYTQNPLVGEPEELDEDDNYSYLCELTKSTPGVSVNPERQIKGLPHGEARQTLERASSGLR